MELEEMRNAWQEVSEKVKNQEFLTTRMIEKMTHEKYQSKLNKIRYPEYIGAIICYIGAVYLTINFTRLTDTIMQLFACIAIVLLLILPVISLQSLRKIKSINISSKTYLETIEDFVKRKIAFQKFQQLNISLGLFLLLVSIPVLSAIKGKNIAQAPYFWTIIFPIAIAAFLVFTFLVLRSYKRILNETEKTLADINQ